MNRESYKERKTTETDVKVYINLDSGSETDISTGIGFFDHMLNLFSKHSGFSVKCNVIGDIEIDGHHTVEDTGIVIGEVLKSAIGDKKGINRYGTFYVPMMDTLVRVSLDFSGRSYLVYNAKIPSEIVGDFETELVKEFFEAVSRNAGMEIHIDLIRGENSHHVIEAVFKAFARALKEAVKITGSEIPSTKGII